MHGSGELEGLLGASTKERKAPAVRVTSAASQAIREAGAEEVPAEGGAKAAALRLEVSAKFDYELYFDAPKANDYVVSSGGVEVLVDPKSAARADGITIDFVKTAQGAGFKIENPNEPARVQSLSVAELKAMMSEGAPFVLVDVRPAQERAIASIEGAKPLEELDEAGELAGVEPSDRVVFHCHHGMRSRAAAERYVAAGYRRVYNLEGGIDAWSTLVDPKVPRY
jgi:monothiol glutaredoxin